MIAAIVPFATSELIIVRQLGVGVAVAVLLDALIVRPVLLPAAVELLGRRSWWPTQAAAPPRRRRPRRRRRSPPRPLPRPVAGGPA